MMDKLEIGDIVNIYWSNGDINNNMEIVYKAQATGDLWQLKGADGCLMAVNPNASDFAAFYRKSAAKSQGGDSMSRDAITEIEQARQKKQIEQTLEEASWDIPRLLKINARLVKEKHEQAEQIRKLKLKIVDYQVKDKIEGDGITLDEQNRINELVVKECGLDFKPDGSGCDSGDPLEVTLTEIRTGIGEMQMRYEDTIDGLDGRLVKIAEIMDNLSVDRHNVMGGLVDRIIEIANGSEQ